MTPYFSVVLPIYNVAPYLERCILSVLEQSFRDYELILVDDGSQDASGEICDAFASQHDHIRVIHKENGGLFSARNAGLEIASGKYIWWVDSDDFIEPGSLTVLYESSRKETPDIVKFNYYRIEQSRRLMESDARAGIYGTKERKEELMGKAFFSAGKYCLSACMHIYRRDFLKSHGLSFVSERIVGSEDYLFNLEAIYAASSICVISDPLYHYEMRTGSLTQQYKRDLPERYCALKEELLNWYREAGAPEQYVRKANSFFAWHLIHSTCIPNEYTVSAGHSVADGRKGVRNLLSKVEVQAALRVCDWKKFDWKQQLQLLAMKLQLEWVFYWLYVVKPGQKEKRHYENQD